MTSSDNQVLQDSELKKLSNQPEETTVYHVKSQDTLRSIAVTCSTTTSALMKLNRLPSTYIYPGQILFLPKAQGDNLQSDSINSSPASNDNINEEFSFLAPLSPSMSPLAEPPKLFHDLVMVSAPEKNRHTKKESLNQFPPAVNCNGVLKGGSVVSNLLASTQSCRSDEERNLSSVKFNRTSSYESRHSRQSEEFEEKFIKMKAHLVTPAQDFIRGTFLVTPTSVLFDPDHQDPLAIENGYKTYEVLHKIEDIASATMFKAKSRLQNQVSSTSGVSTLAEQVNLKKDDTNHASANDAAMTCGDVFTDSGTSAIRRTQNDHLQELSPMAEDGNALVSSDSKEEDFNYFYLCIQTSAMKLFSLINPAVKPSQHHDDRKKSNEKKEMKRSCFEVPDERSDSLLSFFMQWSPDNYTLDFAEQNGFIITEPIGEADLPKRKVKQVKRTSERSRSNSGSSSMSGYTDSCFLDEKNFEKEWEIISTEEAKRRSSMTLMELADDDSSIIPELLDPCPLLNDETLLALCKHLPARSIGYPWKLMYSTNEHGMSLKTLYRNMNPPDEDSPCFVLIQDVEQNVFGAFCSSQPRVSDHFYGNGECFLFKLSPKVEFFDWTGDNNFFIKGDSNSMMFGGGNGTAGLWFDEKILKGHTQPCSTFNNATLSSEEDFVIQTLEVWGIDV